ncbi:MAG: FtsW/RodA/SpoVE family cell cycle protein [Patescibacteria group bacterium]
MVALFLPVGILAAVGLVMLSAISTHFFLLQSIWILLGIGVVLFFYAVDWRLMLTYRWVIGGLYVFVILVLVIAYFKAPIIRNTRSWLELGPFNFQPVELAKIVLVLLYANYFSRRHLSIARTKHIIASFLFFIIPAALTALQPDLGSATILFGIWFSFLVLSGLPRRKVVVSLLVFIAIGTVMWFYFLKDYQRERIIGVFYPERDSLGINYSVIQSKIAIGSGGFWGKGYGQGTQTQLGFLTEPANDFILAAIIEEWGLAGGIVIIGFFLALVFQILKIGYNAERNFEKFICLGGAAVFGLQFVLNAGSTVGFMPVVGVTFPFVSYGGSSIVANFFILSLINAIRRKQ